MSSLLFQAPICTHTPDVKPPLEIYFARISTDSSARGSDPGAYLCIDGATDESFRWSENFRQVSMTINLG
jgi:hypothetical protein